MTTKTEEPEYTTTTHNQNNFAKQEKGKNKEQRNNKTVIKHFTKLQQEALSCQ